MTPDYPGEGEAPRRHPHAASRVYDGKAFVVLPQTHKYEIMNVVGTRVWDLIDGHRSVEEIARIIENEHDVTFEVALKDVKEFLVELKAHGMLANGSGGK